VIGATNVERAAHAVIGRLVIVMAAEFADFRLCRDFPRFPKPSKVPANGGFESLNWPIFVP